MTRLPLLLALLLAFAAPALGQPGGPPPDVTWEAVGPDSAWALALGLVHGAGPYPSGDAPFAAFGGPIPIAEQGVHRLVDPAGGPATGSAAAWDLVGHL